MSKPGRYQTRSQNLSQMENNKSQSTTTLVFTDLLAYGPKLYTLTIWKKQAGIPYDEVRERSLKAIWLEFYIQMQMIYSQKNLHYHSLLKK